MDALVTLADILVTDVRPEANGNPFTVILAPFASTGRGTHGETGGNFGSTSGFAESTAGGRPSSGGFGVGGWGGGVVLDKAPLVTVTAKKVGKDGALEAGVKLASFACNFMVDPIKECLVVLHQVNLALLKMVGSIGEDRSHEHTAPSGGWGAQGQGRVGTGPGSSWALSALEEREEYVSKVRGDLSPYHETDAACFVQAPQTNAEYTHPLPGTSCSSFTATYPQGVLCRASTFLKVFRATTTAEKSRSNTFIAKTWVQLSWWSPLLSLSPCAIYRAHQ